MRGIAARFGLDLTAGSDYSPDEIEFMLALDRYKRERNCPYPSWSEVLAIAVSLGYRRVAEPTTLPGVRGGRGSDE